MTKINDDINEIKISIARVEEHLKGINGSVVRFNKHMMETCPGQHKTIDKTMYKAMGIFSALIFIINISAFFLIR